MYLGMYSLRIYVLGAVLTVDIGDKALLLGYQTRPFLVYESYVLLLYFLSSLWAADGAFPFSADSDFLHFTALISYFHLPLI